MVRTEDYVATWDGEKGHYAGDGLKLTTTDKGYKLHNGQPNEVYLLVPKEAIPLIRKGADFVPTESSGPIHEFAKHTLVGKMDTLPEDEKLALDHMLTLIIHRAGKQEERRGLRKNIPYQEPRSPGEYDHWG